MRSMKPVCLSRGDWRAELLPDFACSLIRLSCDGQEIIRSPRSEEAYLAQPIVYGTAFLLPPDRTIGGCFTFQGREYHLPINDSRKLSNLHGLMHDAPFELLSQNDSRVVFCYDNKGERYPFPFRCTVTCTLEDSCLLEYTFENTGDRDMPILFGLHANFRDFGYVQVPVSGEMIMNPLTLVPDPEVVELGEMGRSLCSGMCSTGAEISHFFTSAGNRARIGPYVMQVSDTFNHWVLWNGTGSEGFISVEPENGPVNGLKIPGSCAVIPVGKVIKFSIEIRRKET